MNELAVGYPCTPSKYYLFYKRLLSFAPSRFVSNFLDEMHDFTRPFNLDRFRIPFTLPSPLCTLLSSAFLSFIFFLFFRLHDSFLRSISRIRGRVRTVLDGNGKYERGLRRKRVISVCPWNSFPIGKLASILVISSNQHFSIVLALRRANERSKK